MGPPFCLHCQKHIAAVISYFEKERNHRGPLLPLTQVRQRVAAALGLPASSVHKISKKVTSGQPLAKPSKPHRRKTVTDISEAQAAEIRNVVYEMYAANQQITLTSLQEQLAARNLFEGKRMSLSKVLTSIGFKFHKDPSRRALMEFPHVRLQRTVFLREYVNNLQAPYPRQVVFLDERWIFENGTTSTYSWQDESPKSVRQVKSDGKRYIVLHAGGRQGFIKGADLIFASKSKSGDYHDEMNESNFLKWFEQQLLPNLKEPSLIIMDNASYHSTLVNKLPNSNTKTAEMQQWLEEHCIPFPADALKIDLWNLIQKHKPPKVFKADEMALQHDHQVLRLPPYHCIFNPIELIWDITQNYYNKNMGPDRSGRERSLEMWQEALNQITPEVWNNSVEHTETIIKDWWSRELLFDQQDLAPLIINVEDSSEEESDPFAYLDDEDDD